MRPQLPGGVASPHYRHRVPAFVRCPVYAWQHVQGTSLLVQHCLQTPPLVLFLPAHNLHNNVKDSTNGRSCHVGVNGTRRLPRHVHLHARGPVGQLPNLNAVPVRTVCSSTINLSYPAIYLILQAAIRFSHTPAPNAPMLTPLTPANTPLRQPLAAVPRAPCPLPHTDPCMHRSSTPTSRRPSTALRSQRPG